MLIYIYCLLLAVGLLGLILVGMINRHRMLERQHKESIKHVNVVKLSNYRGRRFR